MRVLAVPAYHSLATKLETSRLASHSVELVLSYTALGEKACQRVKTHGSMIATLRERSTDDAADRAHGEPNPGAPKLLTLAGPLSSIS
jgi:hypothetical protein